MAFLLIKFKIKCHGIFFSGDIVINDEAKKWAKAKLKLWRMTLKTISKFEYMELVRTELQIM